MRWYVLCKCGAPPQPGMWRGRGPNQWPSAGWWSFTRAERIA